MAHRLNLLVSLSNFGASQHLSELRYVIPFCFVEGNKFCVTTVHSSLFLCEVACSVMFVKVLVYLAFYFSVTTTKTEGACAPEVPSVENIRQQNRSLLVFQLPLPSDTFTRAQTALRTRIEQGVFLINPRDINTKTESRLRSLVREGHTVICNNPNDKECNHFETVLGFYPQFKIESEAQTNESNRRAPFTLLKSRMKVMINDFAIEWLKIKSFYEKALHVEQAMNKQQLKCYYENLECEVAVPGELRFKKCMLIRQKTKLFAVELPLFADLSAAQVNQANDGHLNYSARGFVSRNRGKVETAYNRLKRKRHYAFVDTQRHILEVAQVLYGLQSIHLRTIQSHPRFISRFGNFSKSLGEDISQQSETLKLRLSYTFSLALFLLGSIGLYPSLHNGHRIYRRRILAKIGRSMSKAAEISKIV